MGGICFITNKYTQTRWGHYLIFRKLILILENEKRNREALIAIEPSGGNGARGRDVLRSFAVRARFERCKHHCLSAERRYNGEGSVYMSSSGIGWMKATWTYRAMHSSRWSIHSDRRHTALSTNNRLCSAWFPVSHSALFLRTVSSSSSILLISSSRERDENPLASPSARAISNSIRAFSRSSSNRAPSRMTSRTLYRPVATDSCTKASRCGPKAMKYKNSSYNCQIYHG